MLPSGQLPIQTIQQNVLKQVVFSTQAPQVRCTRRPHRIGDGVVQIAVIGRLVTPREPARQIATTDEVGQLARRRIPRLRRRIPRMNQRPHPRAGGDLGGQRCGHDPAADHHRGLVCAGPVGGSGPAPRRSSSPATVCPARPAAVPGRRAAPGVSSARLRSSAMTCTTVARAQRSPPRGTQGHRTRRPADHPMRQRCRRIGAALFERARIGVAHCPRHRIQPLVQRGGVVAEQLAVDPGQAAAFLVGDHIDMAASGAELDPAQRVGSWRSTQ